MTSAGACIGLRGRLAATGQCNNAMLLSIVWIVIAAVMVVAWRMGDRR
jgi:hypothetical protein